MIKDQQREAANVRAAAALSQSLKEAGDVMIEKLRNNQLAPPTRQSVTCNTFGNTTTCY
jgi:hypothetical protein